MYELGSGWGGVMVRLGTGWVYNIYYMYGYIYGYMYELVYRLGHTVVTYK